MGHNEYEESTTQGEEHEWVGGMNRPEDADRLDGKIMDEYNQYKAVCKFCFTSELVVFCPEAYFAKRGESTSDSQIWIREKAIERCKSFILQLQSKEKCPQMSRHLWSDDVDRLVLQYKLIERSLKGHKLLPIDAFYFSPHDSHINKGFYTRLVSSYWTK